MSTTNIMTLEEANKANATKTTIVEPISKHELKATKAAATPKAAKEPKEPKEAKVLAKADITAILTEIPDTFTPAYLDKAFGLNDGGKTIRRHLRKHFAEAVEHPHKEKWTFDKAQSEIIQYFADRYTFKAPTV